MTTCVVGCGQGWEENGDHCYRWSANRKITWIEAQDWCINQGGHLASVTSNSIKTYVVEGMNRNNVDNIWIGANDCMQEGDWKWVDNSRWDFSSWGGGEPNNAWWNGGNEDCAAMGRDGAWNDILCKFELDYFLCSKPGNNDQYLNCWLFTPLCATLDSYEW